MRMLYRFYDPDSGRILVNGTDIRDVDLDSLRRSIGVVPQVRNKSWFDLHSPSDVPVNKTWFSLRVLIHFVDKVLGHDMSPYSL